MRQYLVKTHKGVAAFEIRVGQPQSNHHRLARTNREPVVRRCLRSGVLRIDGFSDPIHDIVIDPVFYVGSAILRSEQALGVGLVFREQ